MPDLYIWQDVCKRGERSPTEGKWFARARRDGHLSDPVFGPFDTAESARGAFSVTCPKCRAAILAQEPHAKDCPIGREKAARQLDRFFTSWRNLD